MHQAADSGHEAVVRFLLSGGGLTSSQLDYIRTAGTAGVPEDTGKGRAEVQKAGEIEVKVAVEERIRARCVGVDEIQLELDNVIPVVRMNAEELRRRSHLPSALARRKEHVRLAQILTDAAL